MNDFKNILYLLGDDPGMAGGLWRALELARDFGATLTLGVAAPPLAGDPRTPAAVGESGREGRRERASGRPHPTSRPGIEVRLAPMDRETVAGTVPRRAYDLVVKPAIDAAGFRDRLFGSPDRDLLGTCPAPVWHLGPGSGSSRGPVLAAVEVGVPGLELLSRRIVRLAASLAVHRSTELHLVHAWTLPGRGYSCIPTFTRIDLQLPTILAERRRQRRLRLERLAEQVSADTPVRIAIHRGRPIRVIPRVSARTRTTLLVTGASTRRGIGGLFGGSTAETILGRVSCDVLTLGPGTGREFSRTEAATIQETGREPTSGPSYPGSSTVETEPPRHAL